MTGEDRTGEPGGKEPQREARIVPLGRRPGGAALRSGEKKMLDRWLEACDDGEDRAALQRIIQLFG